MRFIKVLALLIAIPVFGFLVSSWVLLDLNKEIASALGGYTVKQLCTSQMLSQFPDLKQLCDEVSPILWMQTGSIVSAGVAVVLLLSFTFFASVAGKNRERIARIFPLLVFITLIFLAALVIVQGAILTYGVYVAEAYAIQRVHFFLIGAIGLGALVGGSKLIYSSFNLYKKQTHSVLGKKLDSNKHPKIFTLIKEVSEKLGARVPEHIVVGLEPNFYVTSADVNVLGENLTLKGETLYLSLPLARILTMEEIKGIIGHELGHFRGVDTHYSLKFAPIYSSLCHALAAMGDNKDEGSVSSISVLPAFTVLSYIINVFHQNVSSINREREYEADKAATEVVDPKSLASSLLKIGLYAHAWGRLEKRVIERMQEGKITRNLSLLFSSIVKYDVNENSIPNFVKEIAQETISHPTDSHPPTANRITELGLNINDIERKLLIVPESTCIELFDNPRSIEESLTIIQQQYFISLGVELSEKTIDNAVATFLAAFGAHMVIADGNIKPEEIEEAEAIGFSLSSDFDNIEFREYCFYPDSIPEIKHLLEASEHITSEGKAMIYEYLKRISGSDDDISSEEEQLLDAVNASFKLMS